MKYSWLICLAALLALAPPLSYGQQPAQQTKVLKPEDAEQLRLQMQALTELLKTVVPPEKVGATGEKQQPAMTMAEVFNKALDMVGSSVATISAYVQQAAPHVWRIMIRQQYANALYDLVVPVFLFLVGFIYYWRIGKILTKPQRINWDSGQGVAWVLFAQAIPIIYMLIVAIVFSANIGNAGRIIVNPEYYAIKDLLGLITGAVR